ncbi:MAG: hypothetical protein AcusKO_22970 [Acuticoccus sp.]
MTSVYERLGVPVVLNAAGTLTRLSGGPVRPEVAAAMAEAAGHSVDMARLQAAAGARIAAVTGAEAGYVTPGAAAALMLGAAAILTGPKRAALARLPERPPQRREFLVVRSQRNSYDIALRTAGARLVEVGLPDRASGAGVRDADPFEIEDAIGEDTAAIFYVAGRSAAPPLTDVVRVARAAGIPVLVDAAAQLPPAANLRRFIEEGADLVAYSGGKAIGGPPASGILCGRADLVSAAALQHLDLDVFADLWRPPAGLIDAARLGGPPRHGIGRACKVGKEQVVGLLAALDLFCAEGDAARHARWLATLQAIAARLEAGGALDAAGATLALRDGDDIAAVPKLALTLAGDGGARAARLVLALEDGQPPVHVDQSEHRAGTLVFNPVSLTADAAAAVADATQVALARMS